MKRCHQNRGGVECVLWIYSYFAERDLLWQHLHPLLLLSDARIMDLAVDGPEIKDTVKLPTDAEELVLSFADLVWLVVLQDMGLDHEYPSILRVNRHERLPCWQGAVRRRWLGIPVLQGHVVVYGTDKVLPE